MVQNKFVQLQDSEYNGTTSPVLLLRRIKREYCNYKSCRLGTEYGVLVH
jgi:hypothetical protein